MFVACVSCVLNISEFCIMGNMKKSTFSPFSSAKFHDDFKNATFSMKRKFL